MTGPRLLDPLMSPADADNFRMTVDYGRWYIDTVPGDDIAPATEDRWPSYSGVKKAAEKDWSFLTVNRIAGLAQTELLRIAELDHTQRADAIRSHEKIAKNTAFGRGTIVHLWAEDLAAGLETRQISDEWLRANGYPDAARVEAEQYRAAISDFFQMYQPEPVAVEYVTIHRTLHGHGYGATPDGLFKIEGELAGLDWKTRGATTQHAAYAEEAAQIAAGARAEYMIALGGETAVRQLIPKVDVGYVVSIKPDGARLYPVDIPKAWEHFQHLHEWWVHRLDEKASIGRIRPAKRGVKNVVTSNDAIRRNSLLARFEALTHDQKGEFKGRRIPKGDLDAIEHALDDIVNPPTMREIQKLAREGFSGAIEMTKVGTPDEGPDVDAVDFAPLAAAYEALPKPAKKWCATLLAQSREAGVPFHRANAPTLRRYELYRGLIRLAGWLADDERKVA